RGVDCVEWGYLMVPEGVEQLLAGDAAAACNTFTQALSIAVRFADPDHAMADHCRARALIRLGQGPEGMALLDAWLAADLDPTPCVAPHTHGCSNTISSGRAAPRCETWSPLPVPVHTGCRASPGT